MKWLLSAVAALVVLAPGSAYAHRGEHPPLEQQAVGQAAAAHAPAAVHVSLPCPGGAGGKCCCENPVACSLGGNPPVIASSWRVAPHSVREPSIPAAQPANHASSAVATPLPRGPPQRS